MNYCHGWQSNSQKNSNRLQRTLSFEQVEPRVMLSVDPSWLGVVYVEDDSGKDLAGDTFEVSFVGGAPGAKLTHIQIDMDHNGVAGVQDGDLFFDTVQDPGGLGRGGAIPLSNIVKLGTFDVVSTDVVDGRTTLDITLQGFTSGDKLKFNIDVDEANDLDFDPSNINAGVDRIASGNEFQASALHATVRAPHFDDAHTDPLSPPRFVDFYTLPGVGLNLTDDGASDRTAAVTTLLQQTPQLAAISGYVYHDRNDDGVRDPGESGIAGISIRVQPLNTIPPQAPIEVTTDGQGFYSVDGLAPGTYQVLETVQPANFLDGKDTAGTVAGVIVGTAHNEEITDIVLGGNQQGVEYNFGEILHGEIRGRVHLSTSTEDCFGQEHDQGGIQGVTLRLFNAANELVGEVQTDANGNYAFTDLPVGTYRIEEVKPTEFADGGQRVGVIDGIQVGTSPGNDVISEIRLLSGDAGVNYDFCEHPYAILSGHVSHDQILNGRRDPGEDPIANVEVRLVDSAGNEVDRQRTDANGFYEFTRLSQATYTVQEFQPIEWQDGGDAAGTVTSFDSSIVAETRGIVANPDQDTISQVSLNWGDRAINYDFGEFLLGGIRGRVHLSTSDEDCFGEEHDEGGIEGVQLRLLDESGNQVGLTTTDVDGNYSFIDLKPGIYRVEEIHPTEYANGGQRVGTIDGVQVGGSTTTDIITDIVIGSNDQGVRYDFCEHPYARISGHVYYDSNVNDVRDGGEAPIANVAVGLFDTAGNQLRSTTTDSNGFYEFTRLEAGTYTVREVQPTGWVDSGDAAGTVTNFDGTLVGDPRGIVLVPDQDDIRQVSFQWGDQGVDYDFGEYLVGSIAGRVHAETDRDCHYETGDTPIGGLRIELVNAAGDVVAQTLTAADGTYHFDDVLPGQYNIRFAQPNGFFHGAQVAPGGNGDVSQQRLITDVTLAGNQNLVDYNMCVHPPASLSGFVFQDGPTIITPDGLPPDNVAAIRDGQLTPDDQRIGGAVLELRNGVTGEAITADQALPGIYPDGAIRTTTDANGFYEFTGLTAGNYAVFEIQPDGFIDSIDTVGTLSGIAINQGEPLSPATLSLTEPHRNDAIIRIALFSGQSSELNNFSEIVVGTFICTVCDEDPPENPPPPVIPPPVVTTPTPPPLPVPPVELYRFPDGSGGGPGYTWHLSIVDAGQPRGDELAAHGDSIIWLPGTKFEPASWDGGRLRDGRWVLGDNPDGRIVQVVSQEIFGMQGATPVSGDFNGDGISEMGIFYQGEWYIDLNGNGRWDTTDLWARLGDEGDLPVTGDWDGDGKDDIGIFGPAWFGDPRAIAAEPGLPDSYNAPSGQLKNVPPRPEDATDGNRLLKLTARGRTRADLIDHVFHYGAAGDQPVSGDWNGDGINTVAVFRDGQWNIDTDGNGRFTRNDVTALYGEQGDMPVVGDFDGDGVDEIGIYRNGTWIVDSNHNFEIDAQDRVFELGGASDQPVVGDWDGDGTDDPGVYHDGVAEVARWGK